MDIPAGFSSGQQQRYSMTTAGESVSGSLREYLGPGDPSKEVQLNPWDRVSATHRDLPDAYKGRNTFMEALMIDFIIHERNDVPTRILLPWQYTTEMHHIKDEYHFNVVRPGRVPHEGVPRLVSSSRFSRRAHSVRYGIGLFLEHDFYNTPAGKLEYARGIRGIACCVQEGCNHDVLAKLLTCHTFGQEFQRQFGTMHNFSWKDWAAMEVKNFACVAKDKDRLKVLIKDHISNLSMHMVTVDTVVIPQGMTIYMDNAKGRQTEYWVTGESEARKGPVTSTTFMGLDVYEIPAFDLATDDANSPGIDLLSHNVEIGEHYSMSFERFRDRSDISDIYSSELRNVAMWDNDLNRVRKVNFRTAFEHSGLFAPDGSWSNEVKDIAKDFAGKKRSDFEPKDADAKNRKHRAEQRPVPFFMAENVRNELQLINFFGQMPPHTASAHDFEQVGQTLIKKLANREEAERQFAKGKVLVQQMEQEAFDPAFFEALIAANPYAAEPTPTDLTDIWGEQLTDEWRRNVYGSLNLPNRSDNLRFPPGFANIPGLRTIASHIGNQNSGWQDLAREVQPFLVVLEALAGVLKQCLPHSLLLNSRRPWFHVADSGLTSLFNEVIGVPRDPIWLCKPSAPAPAEPTPIVSASRLNWSLAKLAANASQVRESLRSLHGSQVASEPSSASDFTYNPSKEGTTVVINKKFLENVALLPREMQAYLLMGKNSIEAYHRLKEKFRNTASDIGDSGSKALESLLNMIFNYGLKSETKQKMRLAVMKIDEALSSSEPTKENIDELGHVIARFNINESSSAQAKKSANAQLEMLIKESKETSDPDLDLSQPSLAGFGLLSLVKSLNVSSQTSETGELFSKFLENVAAVDRLRKLSGTFKSSSSIDLSSSSEGGWFDASSDASSVRKLVGEVAEQVKGLKTAFSTAGIKPMSSGYRSLEFPTTGDLSPREYFRTPLTMTPRLLQTLIIYGEGRKDLIILPSNKAKNHLEPYDPPGSGVDWIEYLKDAAYAPFESASHVSSRKDKSGRSFLGTSFISALAQLSGASGSDSRAGQKRSYRGDDDDDRATKYAAYDYGASRLSSYGRLGDEEGPKRKAPSSRQPDSFKGFARNVPQKYEGLTSEQFADRWNEANQIINPLVRLATLTFLTSPCDEFVHWDTLIGNDIHVPINIILFRPRITQTMRSFILMKAGLDTGTTYFGHANFEVGQDVATKTILGTFTFYATAFVYRDENVVILNDVAPVSYNGGSNTEFIEDEADYRNIRGGYNRNSLIAAVVPIAEDKFPEVMSLQGDLPIPDANERIDPGVRQATYSTYGLVDMRFRVSESVENRNIFDETIIDRIANGNVICYPGLKWDYDPVTKRFSDITIGTGHRAPNAVGTGSHMVWQKQTMMFPEQKWNEYVIL